VRGRRRAGYAFLVGLAPLFSTSFMDPPKVLPLFFSPSSLSAVFDCSSSIISIAVYSWPTSLWKSSLSHVFGEFWPTDARAFPAFSYRKLHRPSTVEVRPMPRLGRCPTQHHNKIFPSPSTRDISTNMAPIDDAIAAIESLEPGEHFTYREIADAHGIQHSTLRR
jgi:hypothetical protein